MQEQEAKDMVVMSVEDLFSGIQESYAQAQQRAQEENKSFAKTEFFRMDKLGVYRLRILPIAPNMNGTVSRPGYEYPVHQMLMELEKPGATGKQTSIYVSVPRATDAGYSLDLIDTYRKAAVGEAKEAGEEKLAEKINGGSFGGGLRFGFGHAMYILDMNERAKGIQLLTLSHSQFKDLDERKFRLWQKKLTRNPGHPCPVSSTYNAYPVEIEKKKNGAKTEYLIDIDNESDTDPLSKEELNALMGAPRIPEVIYRYSRYQFEATIEFLKQCDAKYGMKIMESTAMLEAVEALRGELPKEDTGTFSFDKRSKDAKENVSQGGGAISFDDLYERYDQLQAKGLGDKTEEGQELRAMIRGYIDQEKLTIRVTRSTTNKDLLELIEDAGQEDCPDPAEDDAQGEQAEPEDDTAAGASAARPRRRRGGE